MLLIFVAAPACGAAKDSHDKPKMASRQQCDAVMAQLKKLIDSAEKLSNPENRPSPQVRRLIDRVTADGMAKQARTCTQRMTAKQADCAASATNMATFAACAPEADPRKIGDRPKSEQCDRLGKHMEAIVLKANTKSEESIAQWRKARATLAAKSPEHDELSDLDKRIARERKNMKRIPAIGASMRKSAERECHRSTPRSEVECILAASDMRGVVACQPK